MDTCDVEKSATEQTRHLTFRGTQRGICPRSYPSSPRCCYNVLAVVLVVSGIPAQCTLRHYYVLVVYNARVPYQGPYMYMTYSCRSSRLSANYNFKDQKGYCEWRYLG